MKYIINKQIVLLVLLLIGSHSFPQDLKNQTQSTQIQQPELTAEQAEQRLRNELDRLRNDWANLERYREDNENIGLPDHGENRIVFMGNSITQGWGRLDTGFFKGKPYINRGISGQTTPQMLVRFRPDVIELKPKVVVILAGTNDIAGNTGPMTIDQIFGNIVSMAELARANGIQAVLSSVLPAFDYPWRKGLEPAGKIAALNDLIKDYAEKNGHIYLNYYTAMVDERMGLKEEYTYDGVHPNEKGYMVMAPLAVKAIEEALLKIKNQE